MATWDQIEANPKYQALPDSEKEVVRQRFDASQNNTSQAAPIVTQPTNKTNSLPSWDEVISKPEYQNLDNAGKARVMDRYEAAGGTAETAGALDQAVDFAKGTAAGFQKGVVDSATNIARFAGFEDWANQQQKQFDTAYEQRTHDLQYTTGGRAGITAGGYAKTGAEIIATVAQPEIMLPVLAAQAAGNTYSQISPEERAAHPIASRAKATGVGAVDYAVNRMLPGVTTNPAIKALESRMLNAGITNKAKQLVGENVVERLGRISSNALVGGVGGSVEAGANAAATGKEILPAMGEGFGTGLAFGGTLGAVGEIPGIAKSISDSYKAGRSGNPPSGGSGSIHPDLDALNETIKNSHADINNPQHTPEQKSTAWDNNTIYRNNETVNIFDTYGYKANAQMAKDNPELQSVLGVTEDQAKSKFAKPQEEADKVKNVVNSMASEIKTTNQNNNNFHKALKKQLENGEDLDNVNGFFDSHKQIQSFIENGDYQSANVQAIKAQRHLDAMSPEVRDQIDTHFLNPKGYGDKVDPIGFSKRYGDTMKKAGELNNHIAESGIKTFSLDANTPGFIKGILNVKGGAFEAASQTQKLANTILGARRATKQAKTNREAQERQSQLDKTQQNTKQPSPDMEANVTAFGAKRAQAAARARVDEWHKTNDSFDADLKNSVTTDNIDSSHPKTVEKVQQYRDSFNDKDLASQMTVDKFADKNFNKSLKKLDTQRSKIVDPTLKEKLTLDNINDDLHVNNIKKMDRAQNRDLADQKIVQNATKSRTEREATDAVEQKALDEFRKNAGKDYPKELINKSIRETTKGGKALSADKVINHLTRITDKVSVPGSKEWFVNSVQKMKFVSDADKAGMIGEVNKAFSGGKPDVKTLSNQLGDWESKIHTTNNRKAYAESALTEAQSRNSVIDNHNKAILKASQADDVSVAMEKAFDSDVPEYKKSDFIRRHVNKVFRDGAITEAEKATAIKEATQAAKEYSRRVSSGEPEPTTQESSKPSNKPPVDKEPLPKDEAEHLQTHIIESFAKSTKGKSVADIQHEAEVARNQVQSHLSNNPEVMKDMITGINAFERLSIRVAENKGKDIRDVIKQSDITGIKVAQNSGIKGLIFHALTGKNYDANRSYLLGEGQTTASVKAEKQAANAEREAQAKREGVLSGRKSPTKAGVWNKPKKVNVKSNENKFDQARYDELEAKTKAYNEAIKTDVTKANGLTPKELDELTALRKQRNARIRKRLNVK